MATRTHIRPLALVGALLLAALALWLASFGAGTAHAAKPVHNRFQGSGVHEGTPGECGIPIRWEITLTGQVKEFFEGGELVRIQGHLTEEGVLTNLASGKMIDYKIAFNQRVFFEGGVLQIVETDGRFVDVRGVRGESVKDVGRVVLEVISSDERVALFEKGQHPFREKTLLVLEDGLAAFCEVLS